MVAKIGFRAAVFLTVLLGSASAAVAAARLTYPVFGNATAVYWAADSFPISYEVDKRLIGASPDAPAIIERAFSAWSEMDGARISFQQTAFVDGDKPGKNGRNSITAADDLFKDQGMLAVTTNWYDDNGKMVEADIQVDSTLMTSSYNVQLALEHEVGHLLGLDHSAVLSSVMYPYVGTGTGFALDSDDRIAMSALYPKQSTGATLKGSVTGSNGAIFAAQVVAINDRGEPVATGLTDQQGQFELQGVPAGNYRLYAEPLDGPVDPNNLAGVWHLAKVDSFPTEFMDSKSMRVDDGNIYGNLVLNVGGGTVKLNPRWIGISAAGQPASNISAMVATAAAGSTISIAVGGDGFTSGMTTFDVLNPGIKRVSDFRYSSNYTSADFAISSQVKGGSAAVILVKSGNESATLTGALRIDAPSRVRAVRH
jgi:hypothetical protein